jgi:phage terminase small subunit
MTGKEREIGRVIDAKLEPIEIEEDIQELQRLPYRWRMFVLEYCRTADSFQAGKNCGYKNGGGHLLKRPEIKLAIIKRMQAQARVGLIDKEWVLTELLHLYEKEESKEEANTPTQLKILEHISRIMGFNNGDTNVQINNGTQQINIQIIKPDEKEDQ